MTIYLGTTAPIPWWGLFTKASTKTVTVKVPAGATGYGIIPQTYSGDDRTVSWGNAFRGGGWRDNDFIFGPGFEINSNITLKIEYQ